MLSRSTGVISRALRESFTNGTTRLVVTASGSGSPDESPPVLRLPGPFAGFDVEDEPGPGIPPCLDGASPS